MRVLFLGALRFSATCLEAVIEAGEEVVGVFTLPPEAAGFSGDYQDLGPLCRKHGIPLHRFARLQAPEALEWARTLRPEVVLVMGLSQLLPPEWLTLAPKGCIGSHPTLLPQHRGRHPLIWALVEGRTEGGLTLLRLDEGVDSGNILWQRAFPIHPEDDATSLYARIQELARIAIPELFRDFRAGRTAGRPQDPDQASYRPKRSRDDGEIRWDQEAAHIHNLIRALAPPYPGATTHLGSDSLILWKSALVEGEEGGAAPGTLLSLDQGQLLVQTGAGRLQVLRWEGLSLSALRPGLRFGQEGLP